MRVPPLRTTDRGQIPYGGTLFLVSFLIVRLLFADKEDVVAFMLCSIRTTATGMVIALTYFSPLTALTVAFNMLFQQPLGAWAGKKAMRHLERKERAAAHARATAQSPATLSSQHLQ